MAEQMPTGFIDPPAPFAPIAEWRKFLDEMRQLPQAQEVLSAIGEAEDRIAREEDTFSDLDDSSGAK